MDEEGGKEMFVFPVFFFLFLFVRFVSLLQIIQCVSSDHIYHIYISLCTEDLDLKINKLLSERINRMNVFCISCHNYDRYLTISLKSFQIELKKRKKEKKKKKRKKRI